MYNIFNLKRFFIVCFFVSFCCIYTNKKAFCQLTHTVLPMCTQTDNIYDIPLWWPAGPYEISFDNINWTLVPMPFTLTDLTDFYQTSPLHSTFYAREAGNPFSVTGPYTTVGYMLNWGTFTSPPGTIAIGETIPGANDGSIVFPAYETNVNGNIRYFQYQLVDPSSVAIYATSYNLLSNTVTFTGLGELSYSLYVNVSSNFLSSFPGPGYCGTAYFPITLTPPPPPSLFVSPGIVSVLGCLTVGGGPCIKMKLLTGTTSTSNLGFTNIPHGISPLTNIISVSVQVTKAGGTLVSPGDFLNIGQTYVTSTDATNVKVELVGAIGPGYSTLITNKPISVLIIYKE